ncbi:MAG: hypothetical protein ABI970_11700, partial [Chloroflexota bacterium]
MAAIVAVFELDKRTVADWMHRALDASGRFVCRNVSSTDEASGFTAGASGRNPLEYVAPSRVACKASVICLFLNSIKKQ